MSRTITKTIRFGFFKAEIHCDIDNLRKKIRKLSKSQKECDKKKNKMFQALNNDLKNVSDVIFDLISEIKSGTISSIHEVQKKLTEIDKSTFIESKPNEELHMFFQMVHDRDDAISKKKLNQERESIPLDDDEYIGEFSGIIYRRKGNYFMIQYNRYSVSIDQISEFLTRCLKEKYEKKFDLEHESRQFPAYFELKAVLDEDRLKAVKKNNGLEKLLIKGDLSDIENIRKNTTQVNLPIFSVGDAIQSMNGYEFSFSITAKKTRESRKIEYDSIDQEFCQNLFDAYMNVGQEKDNISVTMQYQNENDVRETLTWSSPLKEVYIQFRMNLREEIEYNELYQKMIISFQDAFE